MDVSLVVVSVVLKVVNLVAEMVALLVAYLVVLWASMMGVLQVAEMVVKKAVPLEAWKDVM